MSRELGVELTRAEMKGVLAAEDHGCLCLARAGEPYGIPISYAFLDEHLVFHCAKAGRKLDFLRSNPRVCFVVSRLPNPLRPHNGKCSFPFESVLCFGSAREVTDPDERLRWLAQFKAHFYARLGLNATPVTAADVARTCCVVVPVDQLTGRARMRDETRLPVAELAEAATETETRAASTRHVSVALVDAFTRVAGEGNRAGIVVDAGGLDVPAMQATARAVAASETAFLVSNDDASGECRLRYFTSTTEIPFCSHATVAMLHRLAESGGITAPGRRTIVCAAGRFEAEIEPAQCGQRIWLVTPLFPWFDSPLDEHVVLDLLGATAGMRDSRLPIQRSGPKLFVPLRQRRDLFALQPNWERLATLGREQGILGVFAFTRDVLEHGSIAHGRYFTPAQGVREDPVTGAANGPLAEYLALHGELALPADDGMVRSRSEQGDAMGKPGRIDLEVVVSSGKIATIRIGGVATTVFVGDLCLERGGASAHGGKTP